jgi:cytoskeletal protein RodZ
LTEDVDVKRHSTPQDFEQQETVGTNIETVRTDQKKMCKRSRKVKKNKKTMEVNDAFKKNMSIDMTENSIFELPIPTKAVSMNAS